jgi:DMSO/TMAO reductase YedYZ molybdopterin-dependent catalytic subunit
MTLDERAYDEERLEQRLRQLGRRGLSRRSVLRGAAVAGGGAALTLAVPRLSEAADPLVVTECSGVVKPTPPELFRTLGTNREMLWEAMAGQGYLTPADRFFVRNHTCTPRIDTRNWRLRIEGSGVERTVNISYNDILDAPHSDKATVVKAVECAGNARGFFGTQQGTPASGTQWRLGAVGVAAWTGVRLSALLRRARVKPTAVDVMPEGLDDPVADQGHVRRPLPVAKALHPDTLLVYEMNGRPLPPDHGFPVRLLVPGWVGISSIKWVGRIEVSDQPLFSPWNTTSYRLFGDAYPDSPLVTEQVVKSALELPFPATLAAGEQTLTGRSWSGTGSISAVDVSVDGGVTWAPARLSPVNLSQAWVRWSFPWSPTPGQYVVKVRARDSRGRVQPATVPFNTQGYLFWAVVDHPVTVQ